MKSKVLSSSYDAGPGLFEEAARQEEEALELVKDGVPVGEPEHLVERMMHKLDSALRRRDESIKQAIVNLEEDNQHLRSEVEMYRARETSGGGKSTELEAKIQEVLDNMERLRQRTPPSSSSHSKEEKELPPIDGKAVMRHKRRSKSRAKSKARARESGKSSSSGTSSSRHKQGDAYQADSSTSSDSEPGLRKPVGGMQLDVMQTMVQTAQQDNNLLRQDLLVQKERESQLVKRNMELEAKLLRALTPRGSPKGERESPVGVPLPSEAVVPPIRSKPASPRQDTKQAPALVPVTMEDKACMTDLPPPLMLESPTSSSPSKSESPTKDETGTKTVRVGRKSRSKVKVKRISNMDEVTETMEVFGRGSGVDGGTPSPSPSRGEKDNEVKEKAVEDTIVNTVEDVSKIVPTEEPNVPPAKTKPVKASSLTRQPNIKEIKSDDTKNKNGNAKTSKSPPGSKENLKVETKDVKKVSIEDSAKKMPPQKEELKKPTPPKPKEKTKKTNGSSVVNGGNSIKESTSPKESSVTRDQNKLMVNLSDTRSKVIEGDDFRVTITSNQDMVSCELSDREDEPGSPRKKIIITPKTPDKKGEKRKEEKKEVVVAKKSNGKIPIRQTYIKQKTEIPAPQMYPSARPPMDQIPAPQPR